MTVDLFLHIGILCGVFSIAGILDWVAGQLEDILRHVRHLDGYL